MSEDNNHGFGKGEDNNSAPVRHSSCGEDNNHGLLSKGEDNNSAPIRRSSGEDNNHEFGKGEDNDSAPRRWSSANNDNKTTRNENLTGVSRKTSGSLNNDALRKEVEALEAEADSQERVSLLKRKTVAKKRIRKFKP